jgi:hypothetical protein
VGDVQGVGHHRQVGDAGQQRHQGGGGGAPGDQQRRPGLDQLDGRLGDGLLVLAALHLPVGRGQLGGVRAGRAVGQDRPAVHPLHQAVELEVVEVTADGREADPQPTGQVLDRDRLPAPEQVEDGGPPLDGQHQ